MARGGGARVLVVAVSRGRQSARGRGGAGGEGRGGRGRPYPDARRAREVGTTRGRRERPRGSLQREVGDEHFPNRPLAISFSFYSSPFSYFFFCFLFKHAVIQLIEAPKHFQIL